MKFIDFRKDLKERKQRFATFKSKDIIILFLVLLNRFKILYYFNILRKNF